MTVMAKKQNKLPNRDRIIAAAARLFLTTGFEATTFAGIAKEVGISQPAIYNYFDSKMDLLKAVCLTAADTGRTFIDARIDSNRKAPERLHAYIEANLFFFCEHRVHAHSMMALYYFAAVDSGLKTIFDQVQEKGILRIESYLIHGEFEKAWKVKKKRVLAEQIHSLIVGESYKAVYSIGKPAVRARATALWHLTKSILASAS